MHWGFPAEALGTNQAWVLPKLTQRIQAATVGKWRFIHKQKLGVSIGEEPERMHPIGPVHSCISQVLMN